MNGNHGLAGSGLAWTRAPNTRTALATPPDTIALTPFSHEKRRHPKLFWKTIQRSNPSVVVHFY